MITNIIKLKINSVLINIHIMIMVLLDKKYKISKHNLIPLKNNMINFYNINSSNKLIKTKYIKII
jgi:hypothetical protein